MLWAANATNPITSDPDNDRMLRTLRDLLPKLALHPALSPAALALVDEMKGLLEIEA